MILVPYIKSFTITIKKSLKVRHYLLVVGWSIWQNISNDVWMDMFESVHLRGDEFETLNEL